MLSRCINETKLNESLKTYQSVMYRMCSKLTYFQSKYVKMYLNAEERELKQAIEEKDSVEILT